MPTTFVITDVNSDLTSQATVHNKKALDAASGGTSLDIILAGGASGSAAWYTEPSVPNLTEWPAGDYTVQFDVDATGADITWTMSLLRVNSAGSLQQTLGVSAAKSGTGLHTHTVNIASPIATAAGDRLVGKVTASRAASHGNQTLTISVNGANDKLIGAWSVAGALLEGSIGMTATLVGALTTAITMAGSILAQAAAAAVLTTQITLGGAVAGQMAPAAALTTEIHLAGQVVGQLAPSGDLTTSQQALLEGQITGTLQGAADLTTEIQLAGTAAGTATIAGDLLTNIQVEGLASGILQASGDLTASSQAPPSHKWKTKRWLWFS